MVRLKAEAAAVAASPHRWRLSRGGLLNVWQYDDQVFEFSDGRLLLRGTNGAGKSKTLEMLLPFVLDADRARIDASGKRGATLVWLMLDGFDGTLRTGYLWVELARDTEDGGREHLTLGVGIKASRSARTASLWCFLVPGRAGTDLVLEDANGPLSAAACREAVTETGGEFFDSPRAYKATVGRKLFGLDESNYDDLLRLLYWLRSPQVGESVEIAELGRTLALALPELDRGVVEAAAENLDALAEFGEQVERRERAAVEVRRALGVYCRYAAGEVTRRVDALLAARSAAVSAERAATRAAKALEQAQVAERTAMTGAAAAASALDAADARRHQLETSQAARDLEALGLLKSQAEQAKRFAGELGAQSRAAAARSTAAQEIVVRTGQEIDSRLARLAATVDRSELVRLGLPELAEPALDALDTHRVSLGDTGRALGSAAAVVAVCLQALGTVEKALAVQATMEELAAAAVLRSDDARALAERAERELVAGEEALGRAVTGWLAVAPRAASLEVPDADELARWRDRLVAPVLAELDARDGNLTRQVHEHDRELAALAVEHRRVAAEHDPPPPLPALARNGRDDRVGLPLWRVVDVRPAVSDADRAGLEAALQSSGLLDALVLPDGVVMRGDDVALTPGAAAGGPAAGDLLLPSIPEGSVVSVAVVERLLTSLSTRPVPDGPHVGVDGSWRLGLLSGRASKERGQYLGATARAAERLRLLAHLTARITATDGTRSALVVERERLQVDRVAVRDWSAALPDPAPVLAARTVWHERVRARDVAAAAADDAERKATERREQTATARRELTRLAAEAGVPDDRPALSFRAERLRELAGAVTRALSVLEELIAARARGHEQVDDAQFLQQAAGQAAATAAAAITTAERVGAAYDARHEALSATQQELADALASAADEQEEAKEASKAAVEVRIAAAEARTRAEDARTHTDQAQQDAYQRRDAAQEAGAALHRAPGLVAAALSGGDVEVADWEALRAAVGEVPLADANALLTAHRDLVSGPAGHLQVRLETSADGLYVVTGRDDEGQAPLAALAARLSARVEHDRTLLTAQQREVCERHLLGELGEVLRKRRLEAALLVAHMNALLDGVRTSQGIRARLDWRLREDAPEHIRGTVGLLERPLGSLLPAQREQLLELLSSLIESARSENPDGGYAEHLRTALDYRTWNAFSVLIRRPGAASEERLSRRTALSQGEQKVVCYLPLFAAAAAHFTSLAAEAPLAPRFVLLDDAFPKIDVRTHPVLFGLLVDLQLDWVVTSERLWGDYPTVPAVAVYEVLRSSQERGVLPYKHLWDGRTLRAVGA